MPVLPNVVALSNAVLFPSEVLGMPKIGRSDAVAVAVAVADQPFDMNFCSVLTATEASA